MTDDAGENLTKTTKDSCMLAALGYCSAPKQPLTAAGLVCETVKWFYCSHRRSVSAETEVRRKLLWLICSICHLSPG